MTSPHGEHAANLAAQRDRAHEKVAELRRERDRLATEQHDLITRYAFGEAEATAERITAVDAQITSAEHHASAIVAAHAEAAREAARAELLARIESHRAARDAHRAETDERLTEVNQLLDKVREAARAARVAEDRAVYHAFELHQARHQAEHFDSPTVPMTKFSPHRPATNMINNSAALHDIVGAH